MKVSNRKKTTKYNFVFIMIAIMLAVGIALFLLERYKFDVLGWESWLFIFIPVLIIVLIKLRGRQIFEYDSEGEAIHFHNYSTITFGKKKTKDEFPKYKLQSYEIIDLLFVRKLFITISSKKAKSLILKYDISYLNNTEVKNLSASLSRAIKANLTNKDNDPEN